MGHGRDFLRRAKDLGVLTEAELGQCLRLEEDERTPHRVEYTEIPIKDFADTLEKDFQNTLAFIAKKSPINVRVQLWQTIRGLGVDFKCYRSAVEQGQDHVFEEVWKKRSGPRGRPLDELLKEGRSLKEQYGGLKKRFLEKHDKKLLKQMIKLNRKLEPIQEKLERDYGISDY